MTMIAYIYAWACALMIFVPSRLEKRDAILTQKMLNDAKETFVVKDNYDLLGQKLMIPDGLKLSFSGGSVDNGELCGSDSEIDVKGHSPIFGFDIKISGTWRVPEVHDGWFAFDKSPDFISNNLINNVLAFSNDTSYCHLVFDENRTYFYELGYHDGGFLGEMVSYKVVDGKKKRTYSDLLTDDFSFLRIFSIPSNTRLTVNNTWIMLPTNMGAYFVFWEKFKENITIDGFGKICGDAKTHLYTQPFNVDSKRYFGEWGMIFEFISCRNITFRDITIEGAFGDCLYFSSRITKGVSHKKQIARGLLMDNVTVRYGRRNGVVIGAQDVVIRNCLFEKCGIDEIHGTQPWAAIDFESDDLKKNDFFYCDNVQMINCVFRDNRIDVNSYGVTSPNFGKYAITIKNCSFYNAVSVNSSHWMRFIKCHFSFLQSGKNTFSMFTNSTNLSFEDCSFDKLDKNRQAKSLLKGNRFTNCTVGEKSLKKE